MMLEGMLLWGSRNHLVASTVLSNRTLNETKGFVDYLLL